MTLGGSYNDTEIKDGKLFVQQCGNFANTGGVAGCTVTDPVGPFPGTVRIDGNPLPRAPKWQSNFTLRYSMPMAERRVLRATDWAYRSTYNMFLYEAKEYKAKSLLEGGLRVGYKWHDGKYEVAAFAPQHHRQGASGRRDRLRQPDRHPERAAHAGRPVQGQLLSWLLECEKSSLAELFFRRASFVT